MGGFGILETKLYPMDETKNTYSLSQERQKTYVIHEK